MDAVLLALFCAVCGQAPDVAPAGGRDRVVAERALAEGLAHVEEARHAEALERFRSALSTWREIGDRPAEARTLYLIGRAHHALFEYETALVSLEDALRLRRDLGDRAGQAEVLLHIGTAHDTLGNTRRRLETAREIVEIHRQAGDRRQEASALAELGAASANSGALQEALDLFREALALHRQVGNRPGEAAALGNVGALHEELGDSASAIAAYQQALPIWQALGERGEEANSYNNLAAAHSSLGDSPRALELYRRALSLVDESASAARPRRASVLNNLGYELSVLGSHGEARTALEEGLRIALEVSSTGLEAAIRSNLGVACAGLGQSREAREHYERALALARARHDPGREAKVLERMAQLFSDSGDLAAARSAAEATIATLESMRRRISSIRLRSSFVASVRRAYELQVDILMGLHRQRPGHGFDARALEVSELARARGLLDLLNEAGLQVRAGVDPALLEEERAVHDRLNAALDRQLRVARGPQGEERTAQAARAVQALSTELDAVREKLRTSNPRFAALRAPAPPSADEIRRAVGADTVLLEYALGEKRSFVWALSSEALSAYELPSRAVIEKAARDAYGAAAERAAPKRPDAGALLHLSRVILAPAAERLSKKRLLIVADGALHYVPFAALPHPRAPGEPLLARHEIVGAPSASVLALVRRESGQRRAAPRAVAVFADPVFERSDERFRAAGAGGGARATDEPLTQALRSAGLEGGLARLAFTRREADSILSLVPAGARKAALGFDASRTTVTHPSLADFRIVHFATHGFLNGAHPELSGIVLSLVDREGRDARGFLTAADVFDLRLNADMVVLSGCRTALGQEMRGEGLVGLSRAFMYAGAPRVVASLWKVDDAATADLMERFYRGVLKDGLPAAAALRAAQLALMKRPRYRDPFYWAAFQLQGEWR